MVITSLKTDSKINKRYLTSPTINNFKLVDEESLDIYEYKQIKEILASSMFSIEVTVFLDICMHIAPTVISTVNNLFNCTVKAILKLLYLLSIGYSLDAS